MWEKSEDENNEKLSSLTTSLLTQIAVCSLVCVCLKLHLPERSSPNPSPPLFSQSLAEESQAAFNCRVQRLLVGLMSSAPELRRFHAPSEKAKHHMESFTRRASHGGWISGGGERRDSQIIQVLSTM